MSKTTETAGKTARAWRTVRNANRIEKIPVRFALVQIGEDALKMIDREAKKWRMTRGEIITWMFRNVELLREWYYNTPGAKIERDLSFPERSVAV